MATLMLAQYDGVFIPRNLLMNLCTIFAKDKIDNIDNIVILDRQLLKNTITDISVYISISNHRKILARRLNAI